MASYSLILLLLVVSMFTAACFARPRTPAIVALTGGTSAVGALMFLYWYLALIHDVPVPRPLLALWHAWGILSLTLLISGVAGLAAQLLRTNGR